MFLIKRINNLWDKQTHPSLSPRDHFYDKNHMHFERREFVFNYINKYSKIFMKVKWKFFY